MLRKHFKTTNKQTEKQKQKQQKKKQTIKKPKPNQRRSRQELLQHVVWSEISCLAHPRNRRNPGDAETRQFYSYWFLFPMTVKTPGNIIKAMSSSIAVIFH